MVSSPRSDKNLVYVSDMCLAPSFLGRNQAFVKNLALQSAMRCRSLAVSRCTTSSSIQLKRTTRRVFIAALAAIPIAPILSTATNTSAVAEALGELEAARNSLVALEELARTMNYTSLRQSLRAGPLGRIRSAGTTLLRAIPQGTKRAEAEMAYKKLIKVVENADAKALKVSRGELEEDIQRLVQDMQKVFSDFVTVAQ